MTANVHSLESIEAVRDALTLFEERVSDALTEIAAELRRMQEWLDSDRPRYWRTQQRIAMDRVHESQQALHRCLMFPVADERPSCYEERQDLKSAQARLAYCDEKIERVRRWQQSLQHEMYEYAGRISQLERAIDVDLPQAKNVLARIIHHLEEYNSLRTREPKASYDSAAIAQAIWPNGAAASAASETRNASVPENDQNKAPVSAADSGIVAEVSHDAKV